MRETKYKQINLNLTPEEYTSLCEMAEKLRGTKSQVIRLAFHNFYSSMKTQEEDSS
jgi:hypothetical protein